MNSRPVSAVKDLNKDLPEMSTDGFNQKHVPAASSHLPIYEDSPEKSSPIKAVELPKDDSETSRHEDPEAQEAPESSQHPTHQSVRREEEEQEDDEVIQETSAIEEAPK